MKTQLHKIQKTVLTGLITVAAIVTSIPVMAIDVPVADDAMAISGNPTNNAGIHVSLNVSGLASSIRYSYLKFNVASFVPAGTTPDDIQKAVIRLYPSVVTTAGSIAVHNVTGSWVEGKKNNTAASAGELTWNIKPTEEASPRSTFTIATTDSDEFQTVDVTALVKEWLGGPPSTTNFGIVLKPASGSLVNVAFDSKENISNAHQPTLDITYDKKVNLSAYNQPGSFTTLSATTLSGNGAGLTGLTAANITGQVSSAQLAPGLALGGTTTGSFSGNGAALTGLAAANISGQIGSSQLAPGLSLIGPTQIGGLLTNGGSTHPNLWDTFNVPPRTTNTGEFNLFIGRSAGTGNTTGRYNTAIGDYSLRLGNSAGEYSTAIGSYAMAGSASSTSSYCTALGFGALSSGSGVYCTATGAYALLLNTSEGFANTANGYSSLGANSTGSQNTGIGYLSLSNNTTGIGNLAFGFAAGANIITGSNNIDIGNVGEVGDSNTIRIGTQGTQTVTQIAGISGATSSGGVAVYINSSGVLGTLTSSARFKQNIADMDSESSALLKLRPVTFQYKPELDGKGIPQFGLIAEEVDKIDSRLVVRDDKGEIYTVRYEQVNAMLLNEFLKDHRTLTELREENAALKKQLGTFGERLTKLEATSPAAPVLTSTAAIEAK